MPKYNRKYDLDKDLRDNYGYNSINEVISEGFSCRLSDKIKKDLDGYIDKFCNNATENKGIDTKVIVSDINFITDFTDLVLFLYKKYASTDVIIHSTRLITKKMLGENIGEIFDQFKDKKSEDRYMYIFDSIRSYIHKIIRSKYPEFTLLTHFDNFKNIHTLHNLIEQYGQKKIKEWYQIGFNALYDSRYDKIYEEHTFDSIFFGAMPKDLQKKVLDTLNYMPEINLGQYIHNENLYRDIITLYIELYFSIDEYTLKSILKNIEESDIKYCCDLASSGYTQKFLNFYQLKYNYNLDPYSEYNTYMFPVIDFVYKYVSKTNIRNFPEILNDKEKLNDLVTKAYEYYKDNNYRIYNLETHGNLCGFLPSLVNEKIDYLKRKLAEDNDEEDNDEEDNDEEVYNNRYNDFFDDRMYINNKLSLQEKFLLKSNNFRSLKNFDELINICLDQPHLSIDFFISFLSTNNNIDADIEDRLIDKFKELFDEISTDHYLFNEFIENVNKNWYRYHKKFMDKFESLLIERLDHIEYSVQNYFYIIEVAHNFPVAIQKKIELSLIESIKRCDVSNLSIIIQKKKLFRFFEDKVEETVVNIVIDQIKKKPSYRTPHHLLKHIDLFNKHLSKDDLNLLISSLLNDIYPVENYINELEKTKNILDSYIQKFDLDIQYTIADSLIDQINSTAEKSVRLWEESCIYYKYESFCEKLEINQLKSILPKELFTYFEKKLFEVYVKYSMREYKNITNYLSGPNPRVFLELDEDQKTEYKKIFMDHIKSLFDSNDIITSEKVYNLLLKIPNSININKQESIDLCTSIINKLVAKLEEKDIPADSNNFAFFHLIDYIKMDLSYLDPDLVNRFKKKCIENENASDYYLEKEEVENLLYLQDSPYITKNDTYFDVNLYPEYYELLEEISHTCLKNIKPKEVISLLKNIDIKNKRFDTKKIKSIIYNDLIKCKNTINYDFFESTKDLLLLIKPDIFGKFDFKPKELKTINTHFCEKIVTCFSRLADDTNNNIIKILQLFDQNVWETIRELDMYPSISESYIKLVTSTERNVMDYVLESDLFQFLDKKDQNKLKEVLHLNLSRMIKSDPYIGIQFLMDYETYETFQSTTIVNKERYFETIYSCIKNNDFSAILFNQRYADKLESIYGQEEAVSLFDVQTNRYLAIGLGVPQIEKYRHILNIFRTFSESDIITQAKDILNPKICIDHFISILNNKYAKNFVSDSNNIKSRFSVSIQKHWDYIIDNVIKLLEDTFYSENIDKFNQNIKFLNNYYLIPSFKQKLDRIKTVVLGSLYKMIEVNDKYTTRLFTGQYTEVIEAIKSLFDDKELLYTQNLLFEKYKKLLLDKNLNIVSESTKFLSYDNNIYNNLFIPGSKDLINELFSIAYESALDHISDTKINHVLNEINILSLDKNNISNFISEERFEEIRKKSFINYKEKMLNSYTIENLVKYITDNYEGPFYPNIYINEHTELITKISERLSNTEFNNGGTRYEEKILSIDKKQISKIIPDQIYEGLRLHAWESYKKKIESMDISSLIVFLRSYIKYPQERFKSITENEYKVHIEKISTKLSGSKLDDDDTLKLFEAFIDIPNFISLFSVTDLSKIKKQIYQECKKLSFNNIYKNRITSFLAKISQSNSIFSKEELNELRFFNKLALSNESISDFINNLELYNDLTIEEEVDTEYGNYNKKPALVEPLIIKFFRENNLLEFITPEEMIRLNYYELKPDKTDIINSICESWPQATQKWFKDGADTFSFDFMVKYINNHNRHDALYFMPKILSAINKLSETSVVLKTGIDKETIINDFKNLLMQATIQNAHDNTDKYELLSKLISSYATDNQTTKDWFKKWYLNFKDSDAFSSLDSFKKEIEVITKLSKDEIKMFQSLKATNKKLYEYGLYLLDHPNANLDSIKQFLFDPETFFNSSDLNSDPVLLRDLRVMNWGIDIDGYELDITPEEIRDALLDGIIEQSCPFLDLNFDKKGYKITIPDKTYKKLKRERDKAIYTFNQYPIEFIKKVFNNEEIDISSDLYRKRQKHFILKQLNIASILKFIPKESLSFLRGTNIPNKLSRSQKIRDYLCAIQEANCEIDDNLLIFTKDSNDKELQRLEQLLQLINLSFKNERLSEEAKQNIDQSVDKEEISFYLNCKIFGEETISRYTDLLGSKKESRITYDYLLKTLDIPNETDVFRMIDALDQPHIVSVFLQNLYINELELTGKELNVDAEILSKSDPEYAVIGNDSKCCMRFGTGKHVEYTLFPGISAFTISFNILNGDKIKKIVPVQSILTVGTDLHKEADYKKLKEIIGDPSKVCKYLGEDYLESFYTKPVISCDNAEGNTSVVQNMLKNGDDAKQILSIYTDFFEQFCERNEYFRNAKVVLGKGYSDYGKGLIDEPNKYIPGSLFSYTDNQQESCWVIHKRGNKITTNPGKCKNIMGHEVLPVMYLQHLAYGEDKNRFFESIDELQNILYGTMATGLQPIGYYDKKGILRGYCISVPAKDESEKQVTYIYEMAIHPEFQGRDVILNKKTDEVIEESPSKELIKYIAEKKDIEISITDNKEVIIDPVTKQVIFDTPSKELLDDIKQKRCLDLAVSRPSKILNFNAIKGIMTNPKTCDRPIVTKCRERSYHMIKNRLDKFGFEITSDIVERFAGEEMHLITIEPKKRNKLKLGLKKMFQKLKKIPNIKDIKYISTYNKLSKLYDKYLNADKSDKEEVINEAKEILNQIPIPVLNQLIKHLDHETKHILNGLIPEIFSSSNDDELNENKSK